jgi:FkbM family methyltransferase
METLDISKKQNISYCIPTELRDEQILINIKKVSGRIQPHDLREDKIALVSFAPSLNDTWKELRNFKYIITCSGAHKFLIDKGIIPTWHVDLDPRDYKIKILGQPHHAVEYLIASTIHPNYLEALKGYNVKLWHIFANEDDAKRVLPRGEWALTGGSSVGLRLMTIARFMGFTDLHIFGMDGCFRDGKTHTTPHPNAPKADKHETIYNGKKYMTTPSVLYVAKETFHELDQMPDVKATFYGEGLVQDMAKDYKPKYKKGTLIAFNKPELISQEYKDLNYKLHQDNPSYGMGGSKYTQIVLDMAKANKTQSVLDYGCGKGMLAKSMPFPIWEYDPAIPEKSAEPKPADLVVCTDVLEHIELDKLHFVLDDLRRCVKQVGYFVISTRQAVKTYANGKNAHLIVQGKDWWNKHLAKYFEIGTIIEKEKECELHIVVAPKKIVQPDMTVAEKGDWKVRFYTPNDTTKWRAKSLFTKEPSTVEWIEGMKEGDILFDVGANIGSYSVLAGSKGVKVYSFEPEAENYALLIKNLNLNNIEPNAYCMAISDKVEAGTLYAGQQDVGGACHSFNEKVGFDLSPREAKFTQGCMGFPLDELVKNGLPIPDYIKIDVDGFEHKAVIGAENILRNHVKTLLVEVNPSLPQHIDMLEKLKSIGFEYDQAQVDKATRKDGAFKGCAEYIFKKREKKVHTTVSRNIADAKLETEPYPHLFVENVCSDAMYDDIVNNLNVKYTQIEKTRGTRGYPKRFTGDISSDFWRTIENLLKNGALKNTIVKKFGLKGEYTEDVLLIRDMEGYQITPHTDTTQKVISALFYLAKDDNHLEAGTNIYIPKDKGFKCKTGKHYSFDKFERVQSFPYKPNSVLIFQRTDNSFHGVEPSDCVRDVLLYNLRVK